jgi:hypothetical protein
MNHPKMRRFDRVGAALTAQRHLRGWDVTIRITTAMQIGLVGLLLAACNTTSGMNPQATATPDDGGADQLDAPQVAEETVQPVEPLPLVYSWDTEFSAFLSPPIEVRRLARDDCQAAGYEVATVATMALEGNIATATFMCRGDFE